MRNRIPHKISFLISVALLLFAAAFIIKEIRSYSYSEITQNIFPLHGRMILESLGFTLANYLVLTFYETIAFRAISNMLGYNKIAFASFIGYAFSNTIGLPLVSGSALRYRLYSQWGLSDLEIARVISLITITFWMGFSTLAGVVFVIEPIHFPIEIHLPGVSAHHLGAILLVLVFAYLIFVFTPEHALKIKGIELARPPLKFVLPQMITSVTDLMLAGTVFYVLLPHPHALSYFAFLGIYLLALLAGLISQIPGGVGVFETVMLTMLSPVCSKPAILGCLIAYRAIYFLFPLLTASGLLISYEALSRRRARKNSA